MNYSVRAYFDGDHCQHCADRDEWLRLQRLERRLASLPGRGAYRPHT